MKFRSLRRFILCAVAPSIFLLPPDFLFGQGSLTPPGVPAASMKTLDQIEARTPLAGGSTPLVVSSPGSYYLTGDVIIAVVAHGITVNASNVTIDLNGFSIVGPALGGVSARSGIYLLSGVSSVTVLNGTIRNWNSPGINALGNANLRAENLQLLSNGIGISADKNASVVRCLALSNSGAGFQMTDNCVVKDSQAISSLGYGFSLGEAGVITGCVSRGNGLDGFLLGTSSTIKDCSAYLNQGRGLTVADGCTINGCTVRSNSLDGIVTGFDCTIIACTVRRNDASGIVANTGNTISDCTVNFNGTHGIVVTSDSHVYRNTCRQNGRINQGTGILAQNGQNRIDDNQTSNNSGFGVWCQVGGNVVVRNTAGAASGFANWFMQGLNSFGPIQSLANPVTTTSPWANFNSDQ